MNWSKGISATAALTLCVVLGARAEGLEKIAAKSFPGWKVESAS
jgi:hypothetical protein